MAEETLEQMKARQKQRRKATMAKMGAVIGQNEKQILTKDKKAGKLNDKAKAAKTKLTSPAPGGSLNPKNRTKKIDDASGYGKK